MNRRRRNAARKRIIHRFLHENPIRGVPLFATVIMNLMNLEKYIESNYSRQLQ